MSYEKRCKTCDSLYRLQEHHSPMRDKDSIECEVCGDTLIKWNGGVFYTNEGLLERKEPPKQSE